MEIALSDAADVALVPTMLLRLPACLLAILVLSGGAPRPAHCKRVRAQRKARKAATAGAGAAGAGAAAAAGGRAGQTSRADGHGAALSALGGVPRGLAAARRRTLRLTAILGAICGTPNPNPLPRELLPNQQ